MKGRGGRTRVLQQQQLLLPPRWPAAAAGGGGAAWPPTGELSSLHSGVWGWLSNLLTKEEKIYKNTHRV
jgi:hypothetical protein